MANGRVAVTVDRSGHVFVTGTSSGTTEAYSGAGVPLWTNLFSGSIGAIAVDRNGNVIVTGNGSGFDYQTVKYSAILPPIHLALVPDGSAGYFIRFNGEPDVTYRLQRATSVTGRWSTSAPQTAPASGVVEFHDLFPPPGQAFYRALQP